LLRLKGIRGRLVGVSKWRCDDSSWSDSEMNEDERASMTRLCPVTTMRKQLGKD
jgi:hypothetical protein